MTKHDKLTAAMVIAASVVSVSSAVYVGTVAQPAPAVVAPPAAVAKEAGKSRGRVQDWLAQTGRSNPPPPPIPNECDPIVKPRAAAPVVDVRAASCRVAVSRKIRCTKFACEYDITYGTGTLIGPGRVLTCSHLFDDGMDGLEVTFAGKQYKAKLLKRDPKVDMALLSVEGVTVVPTGYVDVLREGEPITICGYGGDGVLKVNVGRFKRWAGYVDGRHTFYMDVKNRSGDSGGGAFNSAGQLVGVQWGCPKADDPDGVAVTSGEPMINFLWGRQ